MREGSVDDADRREMVEQIAARLKAEYDLKGWEDPEAAHRRHKGIAMSPSGEVPGTPAPFDPRRYHESVTGDRTEVARHPPVCLYLEVTNRCNHWKEFWATGSNTRIANRTRRDEHSK